MSAQFGLWCFDHRSDLRETVAKAESILSQTGKISSYSAPGIAILSFGYSVTSIGNTPVRSWQTDSGIVLTWDGRLDNRSELLELLNRPELKSQSDDAIVAAAYGAWGETGLGKIIGDWSLSIVDLQGRSVTLARDIVGVRQLFFTVAKEGVYWSSKIEPLLQVPDIKPTLNGEYLAGWLAQLPAANLTPYQEIHSVLPSTFVRITERGQHVTKYWDFDPNKGIRYTQDGEYEEHFRSLFAKAVQRRVTCDGTTLAELSGGMDSSSIVCMADHLVEQSVLPAKLETISYLDDSEPNWNERPFVAAVEEQRGLTGHHIEIDSAGTMNFTALPEIFPETPMSCNPPNSATSKFAALISASNFTVVLSGLGGDEVMGGVPTPIPELADLLASWKLKTFLRRSELWARYKKQPCIKILFETIQEFLPTNWIKEAVPPPSWLMASFVRENRGAFAGYKNRKRLFGSFPSFQENLQSLDGIRRQLSVLQSPIADYEVRYPFLDRALLEFLYAVPRDQHVRPGQRRSLMRRALRGTVPDQILDRKRKAYVSRGPLVAIAQEWSALEDVLRNPILGRMGLVNPMELKSALDQARTGKPTQVIPILRALMVEVWLQRLCDMNLINAFEICTSSAVLRPKAPIAKACSENQRKEANNEIREARA